MLHPTFLCLLLALGGSPPSADRRTADTLSADPLDPLSLAELQEVRQVMEAQGRLTASMRFGFVSLREPPKEAVFQARQGGPMGRTAEALLYDWATSTPIRAHIDLRRHRIILWDTLSSREPPTRGLINRRLEEVARSDPRWTTALARRGISDPATVTVIPVLPESAELPWRNGSRVVRAAGYRQEEYGGNGIVGGLRMEVDLSRGVVTSFDDLVESPAPPRRAPPRPAPPPLPVPAAGAPGALSISGSALSWKHWRLRFGVHPRRGLELWDIGWEENGRVRTILYRASVSEVLAAYGDPGFLVWYPRDAGNEGLGGSGNVLVAGDAPLGAMMSPSVTADAQGRPVVNPRAVAIYERDGGVLWRHASRSVRGRQLVLTSRTTIDNYDFIFNWIFSEDGAIDVEVNLTGIMLLYSTPAADSGHEDVLQHRHEVAPGIVAPHHQHFFSYRLDFDVDGRSPNLVIEVDGQTSPVRRRSNPDGLWFATRESTLASEAGAVRPVRPEASRTWRVVNPGRLNQLGRPVGYALIPGQITMPLSAPDSPVRRKAGFVNAQLFVTPFRRDEFYAAGEFQNFGLSEEGLTRWTRQNRSLVNTDVVLWYTLGVTHLPRPEEFPLMPAYRAGFRLVPSGFFSRDPALEEPK